MIFHIEFQFLFINQFNEDNKYYIFVLLFA